MKAIVIKKISYGKVSSLLFSDPSFSLPSIVEFNFDSAYLFYNSFESISAVSSRLYSVGILHRVIFK